MAEVDFSSSPMVLELSESVSWLEEVNWSSRPGAERKRRSCGKANRGKVLGEAEVEPLLDEATTPDMSSSLEWLSYRGFLMRITLSVAIPPARGAAKQRKSGISLTNESEEVVELKMISGAVVDACEAAYSCVPYSC